MKNKEGPRRLIFCLLLCQSLLSCLPLPLLLQGAGLRVAAEVPVVERYEMVIHNRVRLLQTTQVGLSKPTVLVP